MESDRLFVSFLRLIFSYLLLFSACSVWMWSEAALGCVFTSQVIKTDLHQTNKHICPLHISDVCVSGCFWFKKLFQNEAVWTNSCKMNSCQKWINSVSHSLSLLRIGVVKLHCGCSHQVYNGQKQWPIG